jgi:hypothetical protein
MMFSVDIEGKCEKQKELGMLLLCVTIGQIRSRKWWAQRY